MKINKLLATLSLILVLASCSRYQGSSKPEGEFHLGNHKFQIATDNDEAQEAFNKGLTLSYAFSHAAAEREFRRAAELDPSSPMPWWGIALVNGPHINFPLVPENKAKIAWDALLKAKGLRTKENLLEYDLIEALSARYAENQGSDRSELDRAYSTKMKALIQKYPNNPDVVTLAAESLMDLHPWDFWNTDGSPKEWTPEVLKTLERAMKLDPKHPGANHLYIHAVEASPNPNRGVKAADTLRDLVPGAGHLVHMPAHIYIRVARWEDAANANIKAIRADTEFRKEFPRPGFYAIYMLHNHHFLAFTRMMQGRKEEALAASKEMLATIPPDFMEEYGALADGYFAIIHEVLMRFGAWEEILKLPEARKDLPISYALTKFTRATAFGVLGNKKQALKERALFKQAIRRVPKEATFGNNSALVLLKIAGLVLDGEIAAIDKRFNTAIKLLNEAVKLEDGLTYDEPPDWIIPVRHTLGVTYLRAGKPLEAERVYREDLKKFPDNVWSLVGLERSLKAQGKNTEALEVALKFELASKDADISIGSSCLCQGE